MQNTDFQVQQIFRAPSYVRRHINLISVNPIDTVAWVWYPGCSDSIFLDNPRSFRFRKRFVSDGSALRFDVSADERFVLFLDGKVIGRGPNRAATIEHWFFHSYEVTNLSVGEHLLEAVCWTHWCKAPLEQLTWRGGFIFKAEGIYAAQLDTKEEIGEGEKRWEVGELIGTTYQVNRGSCWGAGHNVDSVGCGLVYEQPTEWKEVEVVRGRISDKTTPNHVYGSRKNGWMLFPVQLKNQIEEEIRPGEFRAAMDHIGIQEEHWPAESAESPMVSAFNSLLKEGKKIIIPRHTQMRAIWYLGDYYAGYPLLKVSKGKGSTFKWGWAESLYVDDGHKHNRKEFVDKFFVGDDDYFTMDGREGATFSSQWWRCGMWCEFKITTEDEPLEVESISILESRYPLERESEFSCEDATYGAIQKICTRVMQQCSHETLFDGPYYEQQMYPGDTRVQLLTLTSLSRDDRMIRYAIETFDFAQRDDGMVPMNWPTRGTQESLTYTQCWLLMFRDYVRYHDNIDWLKARIPSMRKAMAGMEYYEGEDGLIVNPPGWSFMDWDDNFDRGTATSANPEDAPSSLINLFYILNLQGAAEVERALGNEAMAAVYEGKVPARKARIEELYWDEKRKLLADDVGHTQYSEHAQCLGILSGVLAGEKAQAAFAGTLQEHGPEFARCSVYFSHYLFDAYFAMGRADLFQKRLDLWREYVATGLSTTMESPEDEKHISRSDCHAWGSHPLYWMQAGLAGIFPAAAKFEKVRIAPQPGNLRQIHCKMPHPKGFVRVDLVFEKGEAQGAIVLPEGITGEFVFGTKKIPLSGGKTEI